MSDAASSSLDSRLWTEEPASRTDRARIRARIGGLHCSLCTGTIEKALGRHNGVDKVAVSLTHEQALVEYDPARVGPAELLGTLRDMGYTISDPRKIRPYEEEERELVCGGQRFLTAVCLSIVAIALIANPSRLWVVAIDAVAVASLAAFVFLVLRSKGLAAALAGALGLAALASALVWAKQTAGLQGATPWFLAALAVLQVFVVARHILAMAVQALARHILNQHVLLEAGAFGGLAGGVLGLVLDRPDYPTAPFFAVAVLVSAYHLFSEWLSLIVKTRSSQAVKRLLELQPETARVMRAGAEIEVPVEQVAVGELVRVRPGERVPVDGVVASGHSALDQSLVTGEPIPVKRREGDSVIGGSINGTGTLVVRVTAVGEESFLNRVVREVEDARALKPGILHLVDRVLVVYAPVVLGTAALALIGWLAGSWLAGGQPDLERAVFAGLSVLVMGYPCAVGISAPLSIVRGAGMAAERGILMRTGEAFQGFRLVETVVFDKTGTLTVGKPALCEIETSNATKEELLAIAAAAEASSEHPLAQATVGAAFERGIVPPAVESFEAVPGRGVVARIGGEEIVVGSPAFLIASRIEVAPLAERMVELEDRGRTVIAAARGGRLVGALAFGDEPRKEAAEAVAQLKRAGLRVVLVTGDNQRAAERVARVAGIEEVHAGVLPGEKAELIRRLQRAGRVAMVGDGINDAPALMQADVGIAMGGGTDIAIESADIIVLCNRLDAVAAAREVSRASYRKMVQNVTLAFLFNGVGIPLAATGLVYPVWAMAAMAVSVTAIFFNSLWGRPGLFIDAVLSVGRPVPELRPASA
ncbi:MAG: cation-translocating P-type ATPase [Betaproteobacteria bacterium]|nr:cation-translocating P-type ATPase [Betaproteobacteria bacterium]